MIHQNRCQSWKRLSVHLLTSQWVSQPTTKQAGTGWLKFSGFFAALVTQVPVWALHWQVEPWTAGKLKLPSLYLNFFLPLLFFVLQQNEENQWFQLQQILKKKKKSWSIFFVQRPHQPELVRCSLHVWFRRNTEQKETHKQAGRWRTTLSNYGAAEWGVARHSSPFSGLLFNSPALCGKSCLFPLISFSLISWIIFFTALERGFCLWLCSFSLKHP